MPKKPIKQSSSNAKTPRDSQKTSNSNEGHERFIQITEFQAEFNTLLNKVIKPAMSEIGKALSDKCLIRACNDYEENRSGISPILLKATHLSYYIVPRVNGSGMIFIIAGNHFIQKVAVEFHIHSRILYRKECDAKDINKKFLEKTILTQIDSFKI